LEAAQETAVAQLRFEQMLIPQERRPLKATQAK